MNVYSFEKEGDSIDFCRNLQLDKKVDRTRLWVVKISSASPTCSWPIKGTVIHPENFKPHSAREDGSEHCSMTNTAPNRDQFKTPNQHLLWL